MDTQPQQTISIIPGKLDALVFADRVYRQGQPAEMVTYLSRGLQAVGQRECALTLPPDQAQRFSADVGRLYQLLYQSAAEGRRVDTYGNTVLEGPFGLDQVGVGYLPANSATSSVVPGNALYMVLAVGPEIKILQRCGVFRLASRWGLDQRFYPWPVWSDPTRKSAYSEEEVKASLSMRMPSISLGGLHFCFRESDQTLLIRATDRAKTPLAQLGLLKEPAPFALFPEPSPLADTRLVWVSGAEGPVAAAAPGSRGALVTGTSLVLSPSPEGQSVLSLIDDGYVAMLPETDFNRLVAGLRTGQNAEATFSDGRKLRLEWLHPQVIGHQVTLLHPEAALVERLPNSAVALAAYTRAVDEELQAIAPGAGATFLSLTTILRAPDQSRVWLSGGAVDEAWAQDLKARLGKIPVPPLKGLISFSQHYTTGGFPPKFATFEPFPKLWREQCPDGAADLDALLEAVWAK